MQSALFSAILSSIFFGPKWDRVSVPNGLFAFLDLLGYVSYKE